MNTENSSVYQTYWDPENNKRHGSYAGGKDVIVRARDVKKIYRMDLDESEWVHALRGITMEIYKGEYLAIMGLRARVSQPSLIPSVALISQLLVGYLSMKLISLNWMHQLAWMRYRRWLYFPKL